MKKLIIPLLIVLSPIFALSQNESKWNVQLSGGPVIFYGDIMNDYTLYPPLDNNDAWNFGGALNLEYSLNRYLGLRGQLKYGQIGGIKSQSNLKFDGDLLDASLQAKLNFNEALGNHNPYRSFNTYGLLGIGHSYWATERNDTEKSSDDGIFKMSPEAFSPIGLGLSYRINENLNVNLEGVANILYNADDLDEFSGSGEFERDMYSYTTLGLTYKFGGKTGQERKESKDRDMHRIDEEKAKDTSEKEEKEKKKTVEVSLNSEMPSKIKAGESFAATIKINKENLDGPATLRQVFPNGVNIQPLSLAGGEYNFMNQVFTVNWTDMPKNQSILKIVYRVKTDDIESGTYPISGIYSYTQNANSKMLNFKNSLEVEASEEQKAKQLQKEKEKAAAEKMEREVVFRVQIRAKYQKKMSKEVIANQFNLNERIYEDFHNGYYIYTIGDFSTYEQARRKRDRLINQHGVNDAFVTAFKNGERVDKLKELEQFE
ncbi:MAG: porin family protein [Bacteroidales bacterium]|nr:porin family protein [Bacteroidales bacterium]